MRTTTTSILVCLIAVCGCGGVGHDDLIKEQIRSIDEAAAILEGVTDAASAQTARPKLLKIVADMKQQNARARRLTPTNAEDLARITANNESASQAALERLNDAARKAADQPGCHDVVAEFNRELGRLLH
jgi:hypothetical protein